MSAHLTEELRQDLLARWSETHRKHHTVAHLHEMLDAIGRLAESGIEFDREAVELAAWFHDAIYEIGRDDNEDRSAVLCDADLSVLGSDALRYRTYAAAVREECTDVPDEVFKPARAQVLSSLLDGPLFHTAAGRERWEQLARRNIEDEIGALTGYI